MERFYMGILVTVCRIPNGYPKTLGILSDWKVYASLLIAIVTRMK
mgnify:CR=1 FL=1